jgi:hypothetical protein
MGARQRTVFRRTAGRECRDRVAQQAQVTQAWLPPFRF